MEQEPWTKPTQKIQKISWREPSKRQWKYCKQPLRSRVAGVKKFCYEKQREPTHVRLCGPFKPAFRLFFWHACPEEHVRWPYWILGYRSWERFLRRAARNGGEEEIDDKGTRDVACLYVVWICYFIAEHPIPLLSLVRLIPLWNLQRVLLTESKTWQPTLSLWPTRVRVPVTRTRTRTKTKTKTTKSRTDSYQWSWVLTKTCFNLKMSFDFSDFLFHHSFCVCLPCHRTSRTWRDSWTQCCACQRSWKPLQKIWKITTYRRRLISTCLRLIGQLPYFQSWIHVSSHALLPLRSVKTLQEHITKLDQQYDILNDEMAQGENTDFSAEPVSQILAKNCRYRDYKIIKMLSRVPAELKGSFWESMLSWWKNAHKKMNATTFVPEPQSSQLGPKPTKTYGHEPGLSGPAVPRLPSRRWSDRLRASIDMYWTAQSSGVLKHLLVFWFFGYSIVLNQEVEAVLWQIWRQQAAAKDHWQAEGQAQGQGKG